MAQILTNENSTLDQVMAWCRDATNVNLSSKMFGDIHPRAISKEVLMYLIRNMRLEITPLALLTHLLGPMGKFTVAQ